ncbi:Maf1 regulator-domain-containing protein [Leucosporidium creatinivorum]|uniref:Maf1 regulator-domain-containing protein n=1 Tax=Leucosporidium creatinivorum TaxID=106004 RepID=A0A1Y2FXR6_9BASI|nr:Maf1 regulator-domain-containing protein [Leucosporidium creatinivorum]
MKFLEISELDVLSRALNLSTPTLRVSTRVEAYSCKAVARERKLFKTLESELIQDISHSTSVSPPEQHRGLLDSAFGPLDKRESRKTLWLLIGLLNVAFPDHDFSKVRPEEFRREEGPRAVLASLSGALDHLRSPSAQRSFSTYPPSSSFAFPSSPFSDPISLPGTTPTQTSTTGHHLEGDAIPTNPFLRQVLDPIIDLAECEVFSYTPDMDSDPHAVESDDESDDEGDDPDAFERDSDGGMNWEMEGLESTGHHPHGGQLGNHSSTRGGPSGYASSFSSRADPPNWYSRPSTPMKSISSIFPGTAVPGTPTSIADSEEYFGTSDDPSTGGLLWSTFHFLYNRKAKRIVFISAWARTPAHQQEVGRRRRGGGSKSRRMRSRSVARSARFGGGEESGEEGEEEQRAEVEDHAARMKRSASTGSISMPVPNKKKTKA